MSKIEEIKPTEYPRNLIRKSTHKEIYDQAMQDFLEKAEIWLEKNSESYVRFDEVGYRFYAHSSLIRDFKNYMLTDYHGQNTKEG